MPDPRLRPCPICQKKFKDSKLPEHKTTCHAAVGCPVGQERTAVAVTRTSDGPSVVQAYVGGLPRRGVGSGIKRMYDDMEGAGCTASRLTHRGKMYSVGWVARWRRFSHGTSLLKRKAHARLGVLYKKVESFKKAQMDRTMQNQGLQNFQPPPLPTLSVGGLRGVTRTGCSMITSKDYVPSSKYPEGFIHGPPLQICKSVKGYSNVAACKQTCQTCAQGKCHECPFCVLHTDRDSSATVGIGYQHRRVAQKYRAYLILGDRVFDFRGGLSWVINAAELQHGVWRAELTDKDERNITHHFHAMVFVHKKGQEKGQNAGAAAHGQADGE